MYLTQKQTQIMTCLIFGSMSSTEVLTEWLTMNDLVAAVPYKTTRDSMHFSIRALINKGIVEKGSLELRDERWQAIVMPTSEGLDLAEMLKPVVGGRRIIEDNDIFMEY